MKQILIILIISTATLFALNSCKRSSKNQIVLVGVGEHGRSEITRAVNVLDSLSPKVIAVDFLFNEAKSIKIDSLFLAALRDCGSTLVMASFIDYDDYNGESIRYPPIQTGFLFNSLPYLAKGYCNAILGDDELRSISRFSLYENVDGTEMRSFAAEAAWQFDSVRAAAYFEKNEKVVDLIYNETDVSGVYHIDDLLANQIAKKDIEGKLVLIGYFGLGESMWVVKAKRKGQDVDLVTNDVFRHAMEIYQILGFDE